MAETIIQGSEEWLSLIDPILEEQSTEAPDSGSEVDLSQCGYQVKYKTEKCRYWVIGLECPFRQRCSFAHGNNELRSKSHISKKYKTKICVNFERTGCCKYGQRCQFLHPIPKPKAQLQNSSISVSYAELLEHLTDQPITSPIIPVRRLKLFEEFELDSYENVDWKYKKNRLYSI